MVNHDAGESDEDRHAHADGRDETRPHLPDQAAGLSDRSRRSQRSPPRCAPRGTPSVRTESGAGRGLAAREVARVRPQRSREGPHDVLGVRTAPALASNLLPGYLQQLPHVVAGLHTMNRGAGTNATPSVVVGDLARPFTQRTRPQRRAERRVRSQRRSEHMDSVENLGPIAGGQGTGLGEQPVSLGRELDRLSGDRLHYDTQLSTRSRSSPGGHSCRQRRSSLATVAASTRLWSAMFKAKAACSDV